MPNLRLLLTYTVALLAGLLAGFFIVFNSIFSDVAGAGERLFSFVLVIGVYAILGLILGFSAASWVAGLPLVVPAVLFVIWYSLREPGHVLLHLAYVIATLAAGGLGAYAGAALWARRRATSI